MFACCWSCPCYVVAVVVCVVIVVMAARDDSVIVSCVVLVCCCPCVCVSVSLCGCPCVVAGIVVCATVMYQCDVFRVCVVVACVVRVVRDMGVVVLLVGVGCVFFFV